MRVKIEIMTSQGDLKEIFNENVEYARDVSALSEICSYAITLEEAMQSYVEHKAKH